MAQGKHASPQKAPAARPQRRAQARPRPQAAAKGAKGAKKRPQSAPGSRRGLAILAVVCAGADGRFFAAKPAPRPVSAAVDERVSTSMVRISEVMTSNASAVRADNGQFTDWVEVVNTGVTDVSLKGYTL